MSSSAQTAIYKERDVLRLVVLKTGKAKSIVTSMDLSPRGHLLEFLGWVLYFFSFLPPKTNNYTKDPCLETEIETEMEKHSLE